MSNNIKKTYAITSGKAFCKYFLAFALLLLVFPSLTATAQDVKFKGLEFLLDEQTKTAMVTGLDLDTPERDEYIVPSMFEHNGEVYTVTEISLVAFANCSNISKITLPETIESIGSGAFLNCTSLTSIRISGLIQNIEANTFQGCSSLTEVVIPATVTSIGKYAFSNTNLKKIVFNREYPPNVPSNALNGLDLSKIDVVVPDVSKYTGNFWTSFASVTSVPQIDINKIKTAIGGIIPQGKIYDGTNSVDWQWENINGNGDSIIAPLYKVSDADAISVDDVKVKIISVECEGTQIVAKFTLIGDKVTDYVLTQNEVSYPCSVHQAYT